MLRKILLLLTSLTILAVSAQKFQYKFDSMPVADALVKVSKEYPEIRINLIYSELEHYVTNALIQTDDPSEAIRKIVGTNPINVVHKGNTFYIEARQKGKFLFRGRVIGEGREPLAGAIIRVLSPSDSTVFTYGMTDAEGYFTIPCDKNKPIFKVTCLGYKPSFLSVENPDVGIIQMNVSTIDIQTVNILRDNTVYYPDRNSYIPSSREKYASTDGIDLLRRMGMPEIFVDPSTNVVTNNFGQTVPVYINSQEANEADIKSLKTTDIKKVEYLEYPLDPRYKGAEFAINFIVQEYAYGGYSRGCISESFLNGLSNTASIYSKTAYKRMTYSIYASIDNERYNHFPGADVTKNFLLKNSEGELVMTTRSESTDQSRFRKDYDANFNLSTNYKSTNTQINNNLSFSVYDIPKMSSTGRLDVSPGHDGSYSIFHDNPMKNTFLGYHGDIFQKLQDKFSININPIFQFNRKSDLYLYENSAGMNVTRNAIEHSYYTRLNLSATKQVNDHNTISLGLHGSDWISHLSYSGDVNSRNRFYHSFEGLLLRYNYSTQQFSLNIDGGSAWEQSGINGHKTTDCYPFTHINAQYSFAQKSKVGLYFQYASFNASPADLSDAILPENEYLYITGNPDLHNSRHITIMGQYSWSYNRKITFGAYGRYFRVFNRMVNLYLPYLDGDCLLRRPENNGDFINWELGANLRLSLLNQNLQFTIRPNLKHYESTGVLSRKITPLYCSFAAAYYLNSLYLNTTVISPFKSMGRDGYITGQQWYYDIECGWANSNWNLRLTAVNFFNRGWRGAESSFISPYYSISSTPLSILHHPSIQLTTTFTFGYGKKIQRTDEQTGSASAGSSAILK